MGKTSQNRGALATGPVRRWSKSQPKLLATTPGDYQETPKVRPIKKITFGLKFIIAIFTVILISFAGAVMLLGITVLPLVKIDGHSWLIQRSIYVQGQAPLEATVLSLGQPLERSTASRFSLLFMGMPTSSIVEIVAVPLDRIDVNKSRIVSINGHSLGLKANPDLRSHTLGDQYLGICLSGACGEKNSVVEVPTNYVLGKVIGEMHLGIGLGSAPKYDARLK